MIKSGQAVSATFSTNKPSTGEAADATGTPAGVLYVNGSADGATVTVTNISTGRYKFAVTLPTLSPGDVVDVVIAATVDGVAGEGVVWSDTADTKLVSELNDIDDPDLSALANLDAAVSTRLASGSYTAPPSAATNATAVRSELATELGRVDAAVTTRMATFTYTAPPTASAIADAVWNRLTSALSTANSIGKLLVDRIDAAIGTRSTFNPASDTVANVTAVATVETVTDPVTAGTVSDKTGYALTSAYDPAKTAAPDATAIQTAAAAALAAYDAATGGDVSGLSIPTATQIADGVLARGVAHVEDAAEEGSLAEMLLGAFESATVGTTWVIRKTGGGTFNTRTLTTDADAEPITGVTDA